MDKVRVARCLELQNAKFRFKQGKILDFAIKTSKDLKKGQLVNKFSTISKPKNFKKGQICFFCLEKAKSVNPVDKVRDCAVRKVARAMKRKGMRPEYADFLEVKAKEML